MPFSSEIKNFRLSCLMNQTEFGNALDVLFTTVNLWEKGKARPNIKAMKALRQYYEENNRLYEPHEKSWPCCYLIRKTTQIQCVCDIGFN